MSKEKKANLEDLKAFLDQQFKPKPEDTRKVLSHAESIKLRLNVIKPAFEKIQKQLDNYKFKHIGFYIYDKSAKFLVTDTMFALLFYINIDEHIKKISFSYSLRYRTSKKSESISTNILEYIHIPNDELDTINEETIINIFAKWYINIDTAIEKHKKEQAEKTKTE